MTPPTKRCKGNVGMPIVGKILKGQDFWSHVDAWWSQCMAKWGMNIKNDAWRPYIIDTIQLDKLHFGQTTQLALEPLLVTYVPTGMDTRTDSQSAPGNVFAPECETSHTSDNGSAGTPFSLLSQVF
ncbi:predicted protein [Postia placenta Mad-698-R]|nr:predicted protein [Postia placenta Mad-698-R]